MMSSEEITQMSAGRELDVLVAEHIFGWQIETDQTKLKQLSRYVSRPAERTWWREPQGGWHCDPLQYSVDIVAAWKVVSSMNHSGQALFLYQSSEQNRAAFGEPSEIAPDYVSSKGIAEAICKAALASVARSLRVASPAVVSVNARRQNL
jgi:hypothetical protein